MMYNTVMSLRIPHLPRVRCFILVVIHVALFTEVLRYLISTFCNQSDYAAIVQIRDSLKEERDELQKLVTALRQKDPSAIDEVVRRLNYVSAQERVEYFWEQ